MVLYRVLVEQQRQIGQVHEHQVEVVIGQGELDLDCISGMGSALGASAGLGGEARASEREMPKFSVDTEARWDVLRS